jgi:BirA family biotin operon repressor/biotin-[acetyl-CoA-carboxylase] ligase
MLVWADRQTRGRGQRTNPWWSDAGSLTATVILDPSSLGLSIAQQSKVALAVAQAVVLAIPTRYPECRPGIRWPNDIEVGGRKLGGILPERVDSPDGPRLLIGIGLNVATRLEVAPPEVRRMAATLADWDETGPSDDRIAPLLAGILGHLEGPMVALARGEESARAWNRLDTLAGSTVRVEVGSELIEGVADGIDDSGGLRIIQDGRPRIIHAGRVLRD